MITLHLALSAPLQDSSTWISCTQLGAAQGHLDRLGTSSLATSRPSQMDRPYWMCEVQSNSPSRSTLSLLSREKPTSSANTASAPGFRKVQIEFQWINDVSSRRANILLATRRARLHADVLHKDATPHWFNSRPPDEHHISPVSFNTTTAAYTSITPLDWAAAAITT